MTCELRGNTNTYCSITAHTLLPFNNNRVFKESASPPGGCSCANEGLPVLPQEESRSDHFLSNKIVYQGHSIVGPSDETTCDCCRCCINKNELN